MCIITETKRWERERCVLRIILYGCIHSKWFHFNWIKLSQFRRKCCYYFGRVASQRKCEFRIVLLISSFPYISWTNPVRNLFEFQIEFEISRFEISRGFQWNIIRLFKASILWITVNWNFHWKDCIYLQFYSIRNGLADWP